MIKALSIAAASVKTTVRTPVKISIKVSVKTPDNDFVKLAKIAKDFVQTDFFSPMFEKNEMKMKQTYEEAKRKILVMGKAEYLKAVFASRNEDEFLGLAFAGSDSWLEFGTNMDKLMFSGLIKESVCHKLTRIVQKAGLYVW